MKIRLRGTSKRNIIILAVLAIVFLGSGGYLLWRVNQADTVAPTDSDAGGGGYTGACPNSCGTEEYADNGLSCTKCTCLCADGTWISGECNAGNGKPLPGTKKYDCAAMCEDCKHDIPKPKGQCDVGSQCPACEYPKVAYCTPQNTCTCTRYDDIPTGLQCGTINKCTPPACPSGKYDCGVSGDGKSKVGCEKYGSCGTQCSICANKTTFYRYCSDTAPVVNTCDSGSWSKKPKLKYEYCEQIYYSFFAEDKDGVKRDSINVKLNNVKRNNINITGVPTKLGINEYLIKADKSNCLDPGEYTITASWTDTLGATSTACTLSTTFTIAEEPPEGEVLWGIDKAVGEQCIDEDTENPSAQLSYTITLTNIGEVAGDLDKIVDTLDTKVLEGYVGSISDSGVYSDGKITWDLPEPPILPEGEEPTGETEYFQPGESRTYTYTITIPKDAFGTYENIVIGYPRNPLPGADLTAEAQIEADCVITEPTPEPTPEPDEPLPDTGIFDDIRVTLLLGTGLILVGISWNKMSGSLFFLGKVVENGKKSREEKIVRSRREKMEKKVVKRQ